MNPCPSIDQNLVMLIGENLLLDRAVKEIG